MKVRSKMSKNMESNIFFKDLGKVSSRRTTKEGFLSVIADFARIGVQEYHVGELPINEVPHDLRDDPFTIVRILRPEKEVFADASMQSFSQKPVTNNHPPENINANNFKDYQVGFSGTEVTKNQDRLRVPLLIQDKEVVKEIKDGKDQLSAGYSAKVIWSSGVHDSFGPYDAIQSNISGNHIAIVNKARGGENVRINDSWSDVEKAKSKPKKGEKMTVKRKIKGISFEFSDQSAEAVDGLISTVKDQKKEIQDLQATLQDEKRAKEKLQGEFDAEKKNRITDEDIEKKVTERLEIVDRARALKEDLDPAGKTIIDVQKEAITAVDSEFDLKDKSPEYITAVFDAFYAKREKKGIKSARKASENAGSGNDEMSISDQARDKYLEDSKYAWMETLGLKRPEKDEVQ